MNNFMPVLLIVISVAFYNICQKSTPLQANPYASLIVAYGIALLISVLLFFVHGEDKGSWQAFENINWTSFALGVTIVGIELGYLLLYRVGWNITVGSLIVNIIAAIVLIIVGVVLYKEGMDFRQVCGIGLCVGGLLLINWQGFSK